MFAKNNSRNVFQKQRLPRMLSEGESDYAESQRARCYEEVVHKAVADNLSYHNGCILKTLRNIVLEIYGPGVDKHFQQLQGYPYFNTPKDQSKAGGSGTANDGQKDKQKDIGAIPDAGAVAADAPR